MKRRTIITIAIVLVVIIIITIPFLTKKRTVKLEYVTTKLRLGTIVNEVTATGTLNPVTTVDVGTQVSGIISKLFVDFNDKVRQGQIIALIDTIALSASVVDAEANLLKAQSLLVQQKKEYDRYKDLLAKKAVSQSDYDQNYANYLAAVSGVRSAEAMLNKAKTNLQYATITAPISGVIISRNVNLGQTVAASFTTPTLFTIANDLSKMQVEAKVDEADIGSVRTGQDVKFTVDAYPDETFMGSVRQIRLQPNSTQNVVTYTVIIDAPNPELKLLPGMNANISILVKQDKDVLTAPLAAFNFSPHKDTAIKVTFNDTLWTLKNNKPSPIKVNRGADDGNIAEISGNNVKEGMTVIVGTQLPKAKNLKSFLPSPPKGSRRPPM